MQYLNQAQAKRRAAVVALTWLRCRCDGGRREASEKFKGNVGPNSDNERPCFFSLAAIDLKKKKAFRHQKGGSAPSLPMTAHQNGVLTLTFLLHSFVFIIFKTTNLSV